MPLFDDVAIYTEKQYQTKLSYIHNNPVKSGLVSRAEHYEYSSAKCWLTGAVDHLVTTSLYCSKLSGGDA